jgi:hypothetical protein
MVERKVRSERSEGARWIDLVLIVTLTGTLEAPTSRLVWKSPLKRYFASRNIASSSPLRFNISDTGFRIDGRMPETVDISSAATASSVLSRPLLAGVVP